MADAAAAQDANTVFMTALIEEAAGDDAAAPPAPSSPRDAHTPPHDRGVAGSMVAGDGSGVSPPSARDAESSSGPGASNAAHAGTADLRRAAKLLRSTEQWMWRGSHFFPAAAVASTASTRAADAAVVVPPLNFTSLALSPSKPRDTRTASATMPVVRSSLSRPGCRCVPIARIFFCLAWGCTFPVLETRNQLTNKPFRFPLP